MKFAVGVVSNCKNSIVYGEKLDVRDYIKPYKTLTGHMVSCNYYKTIEEVNAHVEGYRYMYSSASGGTDLLHKVTFIDLFNTPNVNVV